MELKKEDCLLVTALDGQKVYGIKPSYFDEKLPMEVVAEAMLEKKEVEIIIEPEPTEEELAEIEKQEKIAKLEEELAKAKGE